MQRTVFSGMTKVGGDSRPWEGAWGAGDQRGCKPDHLQSVPRRAAGRVTAPRAFFWTSQESQPPQGHMCLAVTEAGWEPGRNELPQNPSQVPILGNTGQALHSPLLPLQMPLGCRPHGSVAAIHTEAALRVCRKEIWAQVRTSSLRS